MSGFSFFFSFFSCWALTGAGNVQKGMLFCSRNSLIPFRFYMWLNHLNKWHFFHFSSSGMVFIVLSRYTKTIRSAAVIWLPSKYVVSSRSSLTVVVTLSKFLAWLHNSKYDSIVTSFYCSPKSMFLV